MPSDGRELASVLDVGGGCGIGSEVAGSGDGSSDVSV